METLDGRPLVVSMSGFSSYTTADAIGTTEPAPAITPNDILARLDELEDKLQLNDLKTILKSITDHIADTNNPHKTDLSDFTEQVIDVLYERYVEAGGKHSLNYYTTCLFKILRIASLEEMDKDDPNLLVSVLGAKELFRKHEADPYAHNALVQRLFPGSPITDMPILSLDSYIGLCPYNTTLKVSEPVKDEVKVPYSYIDERGVIQYCDSVDELPITHVNFYPQIPCFSKRTNLIKESNNFNIRQENITIIKDSEIGPDNTGTATSVFSGTDSMRVEHSLIIPDLFLPINSHHTFSVYVKKEACRYFSISIKDIKLSDTFVYGTFDLVAGKCYITNHFGRYNVAIETLANGWFRCSLTMTHRIGNKADLHMTFFHELNLAEDKVLDNKFIGKNELCGYIWGMQYEQGNTASPYMKTDGTKATRDAILVNVELPKDTNEQISVSATYLNQVQHDDSRYRPIFSLFQKNHELFKAGMEPDGTLLVKGYTITTSNSGDFISLAYAHHFKQKNTPVCSITSTYDSTKSHTVFENEVKRAIGNTNPIKPGLTLYIGSDKNEFLEGYISSILVYNRKTTPEEGVFINARG